VIRRAGLSAILVCFFAIGVYSAPLTILYTNDLHLQFSRLASIARTIDAERAASDAVLVVDAGDTWQDFRSPIAAVWGADEMVRWMNSAGYDAMALGNHDFYWGARRLAQLVSQAEFAVLCSNYVPWGRADVPYLPSVIREVGAWRVLLIGITTSQFLPWLDYPWLHYLTPAEAVAPQIEAAGAGVDLVVVLAHLPVPDAVRLAERVPGIDVIVTGHSHVQTPDSVRAGDTLIVQAGAFGEYVGRLEIDPAASGGERLQISNRLISTEKAPTDLRRGLWTLSRVAVAIGFLAAAIFL